MVETIEVWRVAIMTPPGTFEPLHTIATILVIHSIVPFHIPFQWLETPSRNSASGTLPVKNRYHALTQLDHYKCKLCPYTDRVDANSWNNIKIDHYTHWPVYTLTDYIIIPANRRKQNSWNHKLIRESVDSLCRNGADAQYLSKSRITSPRTRKKLI